LEAFKSTYELGVPPPSGQGPRPVEQVAPEQSPSVQSAL